MDAKTLCLGALALGDASGYDIKKLFEEGPFAHFHHVGFGSIYPALGVLAQEGKVSVRDDGADDGHPAKKVYSLTDKGLDAFKKSLRKNPARDKPRSEAVFMMFFAHLLDDDHLKSVFDDYLGFYRQSIQKIEQLDADGVSDGRLFIRGLGLACYKAMANYMEENRCMLFPDDGTNRPEMTALKKKVS